MLRTLHYAGNLFLTQETLRNTGITISSRHPQQSNPLHLRQHQLSSLLSKYPMPKRLNYI